GGRVIRFDFPPLVRREPRGSRSSKEGPAATWAVYPRNEPVQEIIKVFALIQIASSSDTNDILRPMRLPPGERLLSADGLVVGHEGAAILQPRTMPVGAAELWAIIGPNGSGKSTFVRTALGLTPPVGGKVEARPGLRLAYVPQQSALDAIFPISVLDFVLMGLQGPGNVTLLGRGGHAARAAAALEEAGTATLGRA